MKKKENVPPVSRKGGGPLMSHDEALKVLQKARMVS